jgi:uncharacterized protein (TIGR02147 family)
MHFFCKQFIEQPVRQHLIGQTSSSINSSPNSSGGTVAHITLESDYTTILKNEFAQRCKRNSAYSLRAFARDVEMAPSTLSEVLKGKHGMSRGTAGKIALKLGYEGEEKEFFCDLVDSKHARSKAKKEMAAARLIKFKADPKAATLNKDSFDFIAEWYHMAILSLMACESFKSDFDWIAAALNIKAKEAASALERLERLGFVAKKREKYTLSQGRTNTPPGTSREAMLSFHHDVLKMALDSVYDQKYDERELSATLIEIPIERLDEGREMIREFRTKFCKEFRKSIKSDEVYALTMQFSRISDVANANSGIESVKTKKKKGSSCKKDLQH